MKYNFNMSMTKPLLCPACKTPLVLGKGLKHYETFEEHCFDSREYETGRSFYVCPSVSNCPIPKDAGIFWGLDGTIFGVRVNNKEVWEWYTKNRRDYKNHKTYRRSGADAIYSEQWEFYEDMFKKINNPLKRLWFYKLEKYWLQFKYRNNKT